MKNLPDIVWATRDPDGCIFGGYVYLWETEPKSNKHGWCSGSDNLCHMSSETFRFLTGAEVPASLTQCLKLHNQSENWVEEIYIETEPTLETLNARVRRLEEADECS